MIRKLAWSGMHWWMLMVTSILFVVVTTLVDLRPVVDQNFFFSTHDAAVRQSKKIDQRFPSSPSLILAVSSRDISSAKYLSRIARLTAAIRSIDEVLSVKSLSAGPKNFEDAMASPFWHRLLVAHDRKSSNLIVFTEKQKRRETYSPPRGRR